MSNATTQPGAIALVNPKARKEQRANTNLLPHISRTITKAEWLAEAEKRFGSDPRKWKFVCPACGHVQAVGDFKPYAERGATSETAYSNCIGRYEGAKREAFGHGEGPCNYTGAGLFDLRPVSVIIENGKRVKAFEFGPADAEIEQEPKNG